MKHTRTILSMSAALLLATAAAATAVNGTLKVGGIAIYETGDRSIMQETYDLFDGLTLHQFHLRGSTDTEEMFALDLRELNLDSRSGTFIYRRAGKLKLTGSYDQSWKFFDPDATLRARRRSLKLGANYSPRRWLGLSANYGYQGRDGDRTPFPEGTVGWLGNSYDSALHTGRFAIQARRGRTGAAVVYHVSELGNHLDRAAERSGRVFSARINASGLGYQHLTHVLRASVGRQELAATNLGYDLASFRYTGIVTPIDPVEFKYTFMASRVKDESDGMQSDHVQNIVDATFYHPFGQLTGGYSYDTNDDDRSLSEYHGWRAGVVLRNGKSIVARAEYSGRIKKDEEELTLLKDVEANRFRGRLQVQPIEQVTFGGTFSVREREFPDIRVESEGLIAAGFARLSHAGWGSVSGEYTRTDDDYEDLVAGFETKSDVVTARLEFDRLHNVRLGCGVTLLDIRGDLDIEKTIFHAEGSYRIQNKYDLEIRYNAYNYDDFILVDRYYTANVVWFSLGYDFNLR